MRQTLPMLLVAAALGACHAAPAPTPPVTLPTLSLPVTTLATDVNAQNLWVARDAVVLRNGIPGVYVLQDGRARFRMIRRGRASGARVQILSGLRGDETLVLAGDSEVHDGSPVIARNAMANDAAEIADRK